MSRDMLRICLRRKLTAEGLSVPQKWIGSKSRAHSLLRSW